MNIVPFGALTADEAALHPRPDLRRDAWLDLSGTWEFAFDPEDRGLNEEWQRPGTPFPDRITVPFPWESPAAWGEAASAGDARFFSPRGYIDPLQQPSATVLRGEWHDIRRSARRHTIGWYRTSLRVPEGWQTPDRRVYLVVGAANWETRVFCNGLQVGSHEGGYTPFSVELSGALRPAGEENTLVIRVWHPDDPDLPGGKQHWWYERSSGIWQAPYLEARPEGHLNHLRVTPDADAEKVRIEVGICPVAGNFEVRATARSPRGDIRAATVICPGCERRTLELPLGPGVDLWSPDAPNLYALTVEVAAPAAGEDATDTVHSYFGVRTVSTGVLPGTDTPALLLNGEPLYLRTALHQSFHPAGVYAYGDGQTIRADLEAARAAGLNGLRIHIKVDDPRVYYWADRLGLAILYDLPNTARQTLEARRLWERVLREAVERDANHPSILLWVLFNETWGLDRQPGYKQDRDTQEWVAAMVDLARRLDHSRLVEDNSPCNEDHVVTDVNSWHFYINDYARARAHIADVVARTHPGSPWNYVPGRTQAGAPLLNSEYGGIGAGSGDKDVSFCLKWLTNELRLHEKIGGYVYTELTDLEWEHNGLLRYGRLPKEFPYPLPDVLGADVLLLDAAPVLAAAPGDTLRLPVLVGISSGRTDSTGTIHWSVEGVDSSGRAVRGAAGERPAAYRTHRVTANGEVEIALPVLTGVYRVTLTLRDAAGRRVCGTYTDVVVGTTDASLPDLDAQGFQEVRQKGDYWVGSGAGTVSFRLPARGSRALVLEAASGVWEPRQTDPERTPSTVVVAIDGRVVATRLLPDAPADARGVLSYQAGIPGAYGYLISVPLPPGAGDTCQVQLRVGAGGLALFGPGSGRYLLGPRTV